MTGTKDLNKQKCSRYARIVTLLDSAMKSYQFEKTRCNPFELTYANILPGYFVIKQSIKSLVLFDLI